MRAHDGMRYRNTRPDNASKQVLGDGLLRATSLRIDAPYVAAAPIPRRKSSTHTPPLASPRNIRDTISFAEVWAANQVPTPRDESVCSDGDSTSVSWSPSHDVARDDTSSWGSHVVERHGHTVLQVQRKRTLRSEDHADEMVARLDGRPVSATAYREVPLWQLSDDASSASSDGDSDGVADPADIDSPRRCDPGDSHGIPERPRTATSALVRGLQRKLLVTDHDEHPSSVVRRRVEDVQANRVVVGGTGSVQDDIIVQAMEARRLQQVPGRDRSRSAPKARKQTLTGPIGVSGLRKQHEDEVEAIRRVFERQNLVFDHAVFERALFVPEDHVHDECVKRLPIAGSKLPENPLLARKMAVEKGLQRKKRAPKRRPRKKRTKQKKKKKKAAT
ncbi:hypothetical protein SDRG_02793 [Saprolegnia diclina VS20]|uniref:Uncharacterized protein n=1 Tax=Saprolegnia diclina (strain VS20) TaxID=1156394 RepID=T0S4X1_SAPDV|nr:hypothetical protein SDRG_02793 [Saprolegnia diclina VS20]EQC40143.1 hypothetical protein SDRG_02793 [Saprolegnia diclina VS20]|eukprot:XP_008606617.1 hypothetical protein SDRG_02793 [Saprolegnia diclina VS20]